jgi:L-lactate dehydrogenase complex protein LldE
MEAFNRRGNKMTDAQLLTTCLVDSLFPDTARAIKTVLSTAGIALHVPDEQTCCGQPAFNAGLWEDARKLARRTIQVLEDGAEMPVIVPSGSCAAMIRHGYPELFSEDAAWLERAQKLAKRTYEFVEFLDRRTSFVPRVSAAELRFAYHASCHLARGLGVRAQPLNLLNQLAPDGFVILPQDCCGFGGAFALEYAPISSAILDRRLDQIEAEEIDFVLACDVSCLIQIEGGLRRRGSHIRCSHIALPLAGFEPGLR